MKINSFYLILAIFLLIASVNFSPILAKSVKKSVQFGKASFYDNYFQGRLTASGVVFNQNKLTAAHRHFAFGTKIKVTNLKNKRSVKLVVNDRGPYVYQKTKISRRYKSRPKLDESRNIDLSKSAFCKIANEKDGVVDVKIEVLN